MVFRTTTERTVEALEMDVRPQPRTRTTAQFPAVGLCGPGSCLGNPAGLGRLGSAAQAGMLRSRIMR